MCFGVLVEQKSDWVSSRLDEVRSEAFRSFQSAQAAELVKRKASFGMLDNKAVTSHKNKLYKLFDATYDTIWLRFVFISQSKFPAAAGAAHADLLVLSAIALEVRTGLFDLLALRARIRVATKGAASLAGVQLEVEQTLKAARDLHGLTTMQQRLSDLISEVKFKLVNQKDAASGAASPPRKVAASPLGGIGPASGAVADGAAGLPALVEAPIVLLEERLKHFSTADREALLALVPPLRDLRSSLMILYALRCDDAAVALALGDTLGDCLWRVMQSVALRDDFAPPLLAAFQSARAGTWILLRDLHALDLASTARATNVVVQQSHGKRFGSEGASATAAAGPATGANATSPTKVSYGSASSDSNNAADAAASASSPPPTLSAQQQQQGHDAEQVTASPALAARALPAIPGALSVTVNGAADSDSNADTVGACVAVDAAAASLCATSPPPLLHAASSNGAASSPRMSPRSSSRPEPSGPDSPDLASPSSISVVPLAADIGDADATAELAAADSDPSGSPCSSSGRAGDADSLDADSDLVIELPSPPPPPSQPEPAVIISAGDKWMEAQSAEGATFFWNTRTRAATWTRPVPAPAGANVAPSASAALPPLQEADNEEQGDANANR